MADSRKITKYCVVHNKHQIILFKFQRNDNYILYVLEKDMKSYAKDKQNFHSLCSRNKWICHSTNIERWLSKNNHGRFHKPLSLLRLDCIGKNKHHFKSGFVQRLLELTMDKMKQPNSNKKRKVDDSIVEVPVELSESDSESENKVIKRKKTNPFKNMYKFTAVENIPFGKKEIAVFFSKSISSPKVNAWILSTQIWKIVKSATTGKCYSTASSVTGAIKIRMDKIGPFEELAEWIAINDFFPIRPRQTILNLQLIVTDSNVLDKFANGQILLDLWQIINKITNLVDFSVKRQSYSTISDNNHNNNHNHNNNNNPLKVSVKSVDNEKFSNLMLDPQLIDEALKRLMNKYDKIVRDKLEKDLIPSIRENIRKELTPIVEENIRKELTIKLTPIVEENIKKELEENIRLEITKKVREEWKIEKERLDRTNQFINQDPRRAKKQPMSVVKDWEKRYIEDRMSTLNN